LVICTIQRLFSVITGQELQDDDDGESSFESDTQPDVELNGKLLLPPDFFDLIIVDECHRSIYGRWRKVLEYFKEARIIGLTATPGDETMAFFNNNRVVNYTLEKSIVDEINIDCRVYCIRTSATENGGEIHKGEKYREITTYTGKQRMTRAEEATPL
jgi:type I restriction enzyme R subunit